MKVPKNEVALEVLAHVPIRERHLVQGRGHVLPIDSAHVRALRRDGPGPHLAVVRARVDAIARLEIQPLALVGHSQSSAGHVDLAVAVVVHDVIRPVLRDRIDAAGVERRREAVAALDSHVRRERRASWCLRDGRRLRCGGGDDRPRRDRRRLRDSRRLRCSRRWGSGGRLCVRGGRDGIGGSRHGGRRAGGDARRKHLYLPHVRGGAVVEAHRIDRVLPPEDRRGPDAAGGPPRVDARAHGNLGRLCPSGPPQAPPNNACVGLAVVIFYGIQTFLVHACNDTRVEHWRVPVAALDAGPACDGLVAPGAEDKAALQGLGRGVRKGDLIHLARHARHGGGQHAAAPVLCVDGVSNAQNVALALAGQPRAAPLHTRLLAAVVRDSEPRAVRGRDESGPELGRLPVAALDRDAGLEVVHCVCVGLPILPVRSLCCARFTRLHNDRTGALRLCPGGRRTLDVCVGRIAPGATRGVRRIRGDRKILDRASGGESQEMSGGT